MGCGASQCARGGGPTTLFDYTAREAALHGSGSFQSHHEGAGPGPELEGEERKAGAMLFYPMYLMSWEVIMGLASMTPHQVMLKKGLLKEWSEEFLGRVILISHEWLGYVHPDPEGEQLRVLQGVLRQLASGKVTVQSAWLRQLFLRDNEKVPGKRLSAVLPTALFWLDYSGVPQDLGGARSMHHATTDHRYREGDLNSDMVAAVLSIPAYVERSAVLLVLTPTVQHSDVPSRVCGFPSWRGRGWCRVELMASSLSRSHVRVMRCVAPLAAPELLAGSDAFFLPPGEGAFTCCDREHLCQGQPVPCDKLKIRKVLDAMLDVAAEHLRRVGNQLNHRYLACSKARYLRGLPEDSPAPESASEDFRKLLHWGQQDDALARAGRAPSLLHWAAIAGNVAVLRELMAAGGSHEAPMADGLPEFGWPPGLRPMHLAASSADGGPGAMLTLLDAGASTVLPAAGPLKLGPFPWLVALGSLEQLAAWLERLPDWDLEQVDELYGAPALASCAMTGANNSSPKLQLLLGRGANARAGSGHCGSADAALYAACWKDDSDPDAVRLLLDARCSPNMAVSPPWRGWKAIYRVARLAARIKGFRGQQPGPLVAMLADQSGATPLHAAARRGDVAVMRVLLDARADPLRRNDMGRTALDLAVLAFGGKAPRPVEALLVGGADRGASAGLFTPAEVIATGPTVCI